MDWNESGGVWVSVQPGTSAVRVRVGGELDLFTAETLRREICAAIAFDRGEQVQVDLSSCSFIDTAGLHVLLQLQHALATRRGSLVVVSASPAVRRVMEAAGRDSLLAGLDPVVPA